MISCVASQICMFDSRSGHHQDHKIILPTSLIAFEASISDENARVFVRSFNVTFFRFKGHVLLLHWIESKTLSLHFKFKQIPVINMFD